MQDTAFIWQSVPICYALKLFNKLPKATPSLQDWIDIDFAISEKVDFIAVSFVKGPDVINNLKSYLASRAGSSIEVIAKVESYDSVPNVPQIVEASDAVMVARGDLGSLLPPYSTLAC